MGAPDDDAELVPERNWQERASPILFVPGVPHDIVREYLTIKNRFGVDIANLVLYAYKKWGRKVARTLAYRILQFDTFEEAIKFLESKISLFDEKSKKILSGLIYSFKYSNYFDKLLKMLPDAEKECPGTWDLSVNIFHTLARRGLFYSPECIVSYVKVRLGCAEKVKSKCKSVVRNIETYCKDILEGGRK